MSRLLVHVAVCLPLPASLAAATYHAGDDGHSGLSPAQAWKSLRGVNRQVFQPCDESGLEAGMRYTGQFEQQGSGGMVPGKPPSSWAPATARGPGSTARGNTWMRCWCKTWSTGKSMTWK